MGLSNLSEVEAVKAKGNKDFQKGDLEEAITQYQNAVKGIDAMKLCSGEKNAAILLRATLVSNTAMCRLKQCDTDMKTHSDNSTHLLESLFQVIEDITSTINSIDTMTTSNAGAMTGIDKTAVRSKLFYRRAMSRYTLSIHNHHYPRSSKASPSNTELVKLLTSAQTDLQQLLSFDPKNKAARKLLQEMKERAPKLLKESGISSSSSPIGSALNNLQMAIKYVEDAGKSDSGIITRNDDDVERSLKFIHASLLDDLTNGAYEFLKNESNGIKILLRFAFPIDCDDDSSEKFSKNGIQVLALQSLAAGSACPSFAKLLQNILIEMRNIESKLYCIVSSTSSSQDLVNSAMALQMRLTVFCHVQQDDANYMNDAPAVSKDKNYLFSGNHQISVVSALLSSSHEQCKSTGLTLLATWLEPNPLLVIERSAPNSNNSNDRVSLSKVKESSEKERNQMPPRELADYRKRWAQRGKGRQERSRQNALDFCQLGGLENLISSAAGSREGFWRRECVLAVGRVVNYIRDQACTKGDDGTFIDERTKTLIKNFFKEEAHQLTIEEIDDESDESQAVADGKSNDDEDILKCVKRCLFATALFVANGEVGVWALKEVWKNSKSEWTCIAVSNDHHLMAVASECASAAAGIEGARPWISSCINTENADGVWRLLLSCKDTEVRSGAASTMAKLGLADKSMSTDEGELLALLEVAVGLLEENMVVDKPDSNFSEPNTSDAPIERGIELLSYLSSKTSVKNEITCGFAFSSKTSLDDSSLLEKLVELSSPKDNISPAISYSLATIFTSLSVSIETLRHESFEGKEMTAEQYDDLQAMGKTEEERNADAPKETDDTTSVSARIKKMVLCNVPRALVNLVENATGATIQQAVTAMMRISCETDARGAMIQQGCLSACIKLCRGGDLSENETKIVRLSQHTIAKILITTNPSLLNTSQCMGSLQPLIMLVRDHDSSDLQKFEALLSLANLASFNDSTKAHIVAERGISIISYAMFSNHELVRRAATEVMSNLVPNPDMILHLRERETLKIWIAFASDFEEHFECARAALGCLAMVTQDPLIAEVLRKASNTEAMLKSVLESGNLELMHRVLIVVLNLIEHGGECKELIFSTGTLAFCKAYAQTYQNGGEAKSLELTASELQLMRTTVELAKDIVLAS